MFVSRDDQALAVSKRLWGNVVRAGAIDPAAEPYRSDLADERIAAIDLTDVASSDPTGHGTFAQSPEIVRLIGQRLAAGQTLSDGRASLGEKIGTIAVGAASTVGAAAGVVVSAPFAVIDPDTRETLGDRAAEIGGHAGNVVQGSLDVARTDR
jgi:esterase/lipase superfamily enzyme